MEIHFFVIPSTHLQLSKSNFSSVEGGGPGSPLLQDWEEAAQKYCNQLGQGGKAAGQQKALESPFRDPPPTGWTPDWPFLMSYL